MNEEFQTYQVTFTICSKCHPRKWLMESIAQSLTPGEDVLEYSITEVEPPAVTVE